MHDPIYEKTYGRGHSLRIYRTWNGDRGGMILEIVQSGESIEILELTQEQANDLVPHLAGFAASSFKPPEPKQS